MFSNAPLPSNVDYFGNRTQVANCSSVGRAVIITVGQSLVTNTINTAHTIVNTGKILNFSLWNGGTYTAADPLLGPSVNPVYAGDYATVLADALITAGHYTCVILVPIGVGSSAVADWQTGGVLNYRIGVALRRLASVGLTVSWVLWHQGEADAFNNTSLTTHSAGHEKARPRPRAFRRFAARPRS
jgi:hypothetical protein